jgi:glycosyltransferase involved in cell wall biosynthesis
MSQYQQAKIFFISNLIKTLREAGNRKLLQKYILKSLILIFIQYFILIVILILLPVRWIRKILIRKKLSFWSGTPIITIGTNVRAERLLGAKAKSLVLNTYYTTDRFDYNLSRLSNVVFLNKILPHLCFVGICIFSDRLHFYCDIGLLPSTDFFSFNFFELSVYRLLKIDVLLWTYGADVRSRELTKALGEPNCCTECELVGKACVCDEVKRRRNMEKLKQYATAIFSMGDMIEYTHGSRNDLFFWPVDLQGSNASKYNPIYPRPDKDKPVRIVHAPNHRTFKGTHFLVEAVENLQTKGVPVELVIVEKIPNEKALDIYRSADIIFDQCLIGFHGYFALEGMAMGKPVMCFIRKPNEYLLHPEECPIINTHITTLEKDICYLVENREKLRAIGIESRQYIEKYFTLEAFANRLKHAYKDLGIEV